MVQKKNSKQKLGGGGRGEKYLLLRINCLSIDIGKHNIIHIVIEYY